MSKFYKGKTSKLIDLCESITDCHHSTPKWTNEGKIVIRNFNIKNGKLLLDEISYTDEATYQERISRSQPYPGDLIITREAPMGEVCIIPDGIECCLGQRLVLIKPNLNKINNKYLLYALLSEYTQKQIQQSNNTGSIVSNLRIPLLKNLDIPLNNNQDKIASILSSLDDKIELNNRINSELENLAKTIYDYWFVQFDFPDENGKPYKSSGGKMVYNQELKREIPAGWEVKKLGKILKTGLGGTPSTKQSNYWVNGNIPWLNSGEISNFPVISSEKCITQEGIDNSPAELLPKGSIVISIVRYIRPSILAIEAAANQSVLGIYESDKLLNCFIYPYLVSQVPRLMSLRTGAQQPHINKETIDASLITIPENAVLQNYYKIAKPLFKEIINIAFQNQQLTQLRDWLLPMLMNGQIIIK